MPSILVSNQECPAVAAAVPIPAAVLLAHVPHGWWDAYFFIQITAHAICGQRFKLQSHDKLSCTPCAAFVTDGLERVSLRQLDVFDAQSLPTDPAKQRAFFMDVTFDDDADAAAAT